MMPPTGPPVHPSEPFRRARTDGFQVGQAFLPALGRTGLETCPHPQRDRNMLHPPGKFCIDRNLVRWTLLHGFLTRKTLQDSPEGGQQLDVRQIRAIEKVTVKKRKRLPFGWAAALLALCLLALSWWASRLFVRLLGGLAALICLYWAAMRISGRTIEEEAYQIVAPVVAPGVNPEDWLVVGSSSEITGLINALKAALTQGTEAVGAD